MHIYLNTYLLELQMAGQKYQTQLDKSTTPADTLRKSAWDVDDYRYLYEKNQQILCSLSLVYNMLISAPSATSSTAVVNDVPGVNIPLLLTELRPTILEYLKSLFRKKRLPAADILVFMISESTRQKKPYAIPIQCIPHAGLQDRQVRLLANKIKAEMCKLGMRPEG